MGTYPTISVENEYCYVDLKEFLFFSTFFFFLFLNILLFKPFDEFKTTLQCVLFVSIIKERSIVIGWNTLNTNENSMMYWTVRWQEIQLQNVSAQINLHMLLNNIEYYLYNIDLCWKLKWCTKKAINLKGPCITFV